MKVEAGQIWKERDNRFDRYVRIVEIVGDLVRIQTVEMKCGYKKIEPNKNKTTLARIDRFNGNIGGYIFCRKN
jgi:hypothetical protein